MTDIANVITEDVLPKEERLREIIAGYGTIAVAYSGGVDSTYLADVAHDVLGSKASMIIADSPSIPRAELQEAKDLAKERGWNLHIIATQEFENEEFLKNEGKRCYFCRGELFTKMGKFAADNQVAVLAYGAIVEDLLDPTRVGTIAAREHAVVSPLQEAELSKPEIRVLSHRRELPTWNKASFACLSSRFPKGVRLTREGMSTVEQAEEVLKGMGFRQYRARHHGDICRIEIDPADMAKLLDPEIREQVTRDITKAGYRFVTLDLGGYREGSTAV